MPFSRNARLYVRGMREMCYMCIFSFSFVCVHACVCVCARMFPKYNCLTDTRAPDGLFHPHGMDVQFVYALPPPDCRHVLHSTLRFRDDE